MPRWVRLPLVTLSLALALAGTARAQTPVSLGSADPFAVLAGTMVTNAGPTVVNGDLGVSPGMTVTGFPPGIVNGTIHMADSTAAQAQLDLAAAYSNAAAQAATATIPAQLGGTTIPPGVYASSTGAFEIAGTLTLDGQGDGRAVFIFKTDTTLTAEPGAQVALIEGAHSCNVFWQVGSSAALGIGSVVRGNVLALDSITAGTGVTVDGRLLARNGAVTLDTDAITTAQCDEEKPTVKVTGVPKRCTERNFKARIEVSDQLEVSTDVLLDGARIKRSTRRSFTVPVGAKELASGRHTLRAVSRDAAGNERSKKTRFDRCVRGISFTG